jgi:hypothetical protein
MGCTSGAISLIFFLLDEDSTYCSQSGRIPFIEHGVPIFSVISPSKIGLLIQVSIDVIRDVLAFDANIQVSC